MADRDDLDLDVNDGAGAALRAEMAVSEFMLRYWKVMAAVVVTIIVLIFVYGQYTNSVIERQRSITSSIADVEASLDDDLISLAQAKAGVRPGTEIDIDGVKAAGDKLTEVARAGTGTAAVEAWLKAAEYYRIADEPEARRAALEAASEGTSGVLRYAAEAALANLDIAAGNSDAGLDRFRALQKEKPDFLARQATLDLAGALETLDRHAEAVETYDQYLSTWTDAPDVDDVQDRRAKAAENAG